MGDPIHERKVCGLLARRAFLARCLALGKLFVGAPLALLAPLFLGTIFWYACGSMCSWWLPWKLWVAGLTLVTVPMLLHLEWRTRGTYLSQTATSSETSHLGALFLLGGPLGSARAITAGITDPAQVTAGFVELFLTGPRLLIEGWQYLRLTQRLGRPDLHGAATMLLTLLRSEHALPVKELLGQYGDQPGLQQLNWLMLYEWVGLTKQGQAYVYTPVRERLSRS